MRESSLVEGSGGLRLGLDVDVDLSGLLLPGWQGSLVPADRSLSEAAVWPAEFDAVLEPMLAQAEGELLRQAPDDLLDCGGGRIPLREMLGNLGLRLRGIMTLPLAEVSKRHSGSAGTSVDKPWRECLTRYPLLEPLLTLAKRQWVAGMLQFLQRLQHDADGLAGWLALPSLPEITEVSGTGSDGHDGGHAVFAITFASGHRIFYKPRPVTGEYLWWALLTEMSASDPAGGGACSLPAARVLPGGLAEEEEGASGSWTSGSNTSKDPIANLAANLGNGYGWMEALATHAGARSDLYWERAGGLLCVAQHVALTDLHMENVVRGEAGPAVADAECLGSSSIAHGSGTDTEDAVGRAIGELRETGLLPFAAPPASGSLRPAGAEREGIASMHVSGVDVSGIDASGFFGGAAAVRSLLLPYWTHSQDRLPQLALTPAYLQTKERAKENESARVSPLAVLPQLLRGYRAAARALISIRGRLLASGGWLDMLNRFHGARVVVRPTLAYALLVSRSLWPEFLDSADARRSALDQMLKDGLRSSHTLLPKEGLSSAVREAEADALMALDLPRFIVPAGTRALALSSGRIVVPQILGSTAAETIRCRLQALSEESLESVYVPAVTMACLEATG